MYIVEFVTGDPICVHPVDAVTEIVAQLAPHIQVTIAMSTSPAADPIGELTVMKVVALVFVARASRKAMPPAPCGV